MLLVRLLDGGFKTVTIDNGTVPRMPNDVSMVDIYKDHDQLSGDADHVDYNDLTKMFRCLSRKLRLITIHGHEMRLPEYLAVLTSATQAVDKLEIKDLDYEDFDSDVGYSCLMNGLMIPKGPKILHLNLSNHISAYQAQLLFQGVAQSSCLESLELEYLRFEDLEAATNAFVNALNQNRSLKVLDLDNAGFASFEDIFRAAVLKAKVRSVTIGDEDGHLSLGVVLDVLSSQDCQLQSIAFYNLDMGVGNDWQDDDPTKINTTVSDVNLTGVQFDSSHLTNICARFKSMTKLRLNGNRINDLSALDDLLIGDNLKLQNLSLGNCRIEENCIIEFFRKLPQMKHIRRIELNNNPFLNSHEWYDILSNATRQNTSVECILFAMRREEELVGFDDFLLQIEASLNLNRAWRRHMENNTDGENNTRAALSSALWPLVLERATNILYYPCDSPTSIPATPNAIFWLLRHRMVAEINITP